MCEELNEKNQDNTICKHTWCICTDCPKYGKARNVTSCKIKIRDTVLHRAEFERSSKPELDISERYGYIYLTENLLSGNLYLGKHKQTVFDNSYHGSGNIIRSMKEAHGEEYVNKILKTVLLEWCSSDKEINEREKYYIKKFNANVKDSIFYNIASGGDGGNGGNNKGFVHTQEWKNMMSNLFSGEDNPFYGKRHAQDTKDKISKNRKGKCLGSDNPFHGFFGEDNPKSVKVVDLVTGKVFGSFGEVDRFLVDTLGKKPRTGCQESIYECKSLGDFIFMRKSRYDELSEDEIDKYINFVKWRSYKKRSTAIRCIETGKMYWSIANAEKDLKLDINFTIEDLYFNKIVGLSEHNLSFEMI